jgi:hypothetical protein
VQMETGVYGESNEWIIHCHSICKSSDEGQRLPANIKAYSKHIIAYMTTGWVLAFLQCTNCSVMNLMNDIQLVQPRQNFIIMNIPP